MIEREVSSVELIREDRVLARSTGGELSLGVVLDSALCTAYVDTEPMTGHTRSNKLYWAGQLLAKVTATGRYSYYDPTAVDGRGDSGPLAPTTLCVLKRDVNVQLGDRPAGVWKAFCCFNTDQLLGYAGNESKVKIAMQNCEFITPTEIVS